MTYQLCLAFKYFAKFSEANLTGEVVHKRLSLFPFSFDLYHAIRGQIMSFGTAHLYVFFLKGPF